MSHAHARTRNAAVSTLQSDLTRALGILGGLMTLSKLVSHVAAKTRADPFCGAAWRLAFPRLDLNRGAALDVHATAAISLHVAARMPQCQAWWFCMGARMDWC
jgi:hypothetical protein